MNIEISPLLRRCLNVSIAELSTEFRGVFSRETVARYLEDSVEEIGERQTIGPNFLPVIIERFARERLWAVAHAEHTDEVVLAGDIVVTLGCGDACAVYPGKRYQDWPVPDLAGQPLAVVRQVRYGLYHHVWELLETLVPTGNLFALHRPIGGQP